MNVVWMLKPWLNVAVAGIMVTETPIEEAQDEVDTLIEDFLSSLGGIYTKHSSI